MAGIHDIQVKTIDGEAHALSRYAGSTLLIVNVASQCGFTPQYKGLEALHRLYGRRGLVVMGFPCDQFGHQEPGDEAEIREFCTSKYNVTFPMFAKIEVNGDNAHPLYRHLKEAAPGILGSERIKWNFTKFLVNPEGEVVGRYGPNEKPEGLVGEIERHLPDTLGFFRTRATADRAQTASLR